MSDQDASVDPGASQGLSRHTYGGVPVVEVEDWPLPGMTAINLPPQFTVTELELRPRWRWLAWVRYRALLWRTKRRIRRWWRDHA